MTMTSAFGASVSLSGQICLDAQTEDAAFQSGPMTQAKSCTTPKFTATPDGGVGFDSECKTDGRKVDVHAVLSGDFDRSYSMDVISHLSPAPSGMPSEFKTHTDAHWIGPCKPGQTPGHLAFRLGGFGRG